MTVVASLKKEARRKETLLKEFHVTVTDSIRAELYSAKSGIELDRIAMREIDKKLGYKG